MSDAKARELTVTLIEYLQLEPRDVARWPNLEKIITAALDTRVREVWEQAATYLDGQAKRYEHLDDGEMHMIQEFAAWCRRQGVTK
jgi:hypothetical protein